jgi:hypothetical protein
MMTLVAWLLLLLIVTLAGMGVVALVLWAVLRLAGV